MGRGSLKFDVAGFYWSSEIASVWVWCCWVAQIGDGFGGDQRGSQRGHGEVMHGGDGGGFRWVLLWISDGVNLIGWTLVGFWIQHGWTLVLLGSAVFIFFLYVLFRWDFGGQWAVVVWWAWWRRGGGGWAVEA